MQVAIEEVQQGLLQQYAALTTKARALSASTKDGIRSLARLWQLQVRPAASAAPSASTVHAPPGFLNNWFRFQKGAASMRCKNESAGSRWAGRVVSCHVSHC